MHRIHSSLSLSLAASLLSVAAFDASRAAACSFFEATVLSDGQTQPASGAVDVPTNARIFFAGNHGSEVTSPEATVQRGDDEPTPATVEEVPGGFVVTGVALEPLTTYNASLALFAPFEDPATGELIVEPNTTAAIVFTTGADVDGEAPTWTGDAIIDTGHISGDGPLDWVFRGPCDGGEQAHDLHTIFPPSVSTDVVVIELRLIDVDDNFIVVDAGPPGAPLENEVFDRESVRYELVAIDVAGNASEPLAVQAAGNTGCSATNPTDAGGASVIAVALALLRRRRRGGSAPAQR